MRDIRVNSAFRNNRKRKKLVYLLGKEAVVCLLDLWLATVESRPDGILAGYDSLDVEIVAGWEGKTGAFTAALLEVGLLDQDSGGTFIISNWKHRQPWASDYETRSAKSRFSAMARRHPELYARLKAMGVNAISAEEYAELTGGVDLKSLAITCQDANRLRSLCPSPNTNTKPNTKPNTSAKAHINARADTRGGGPPPDAQEKPPKRKRTTKPFVAPSDEELAAYCLERGGKVDPVVFKAYYESVGWVVGRKPMKSWKAAVRYWETNGIKPRGQVNKFDAFNDAAFSDIREKHGL